MSKKRKLNLGIGLINFSIYFFLIIIFLSILFYSLIWQEKDSNLNIGKMVLILFLKGASFACYMFCVILIKRKLEDKLFHIDRYKTYKVITKKIAFITRWRLELFDISETQFRNLVSKKIKFKRVLATEADE
ncbi:hypothetical protein [Mycoplasmopsis columboralis]|uniref:hypothetical protein n=1 Tax=Mycoplasmopsis columboralis TaxID=171282 RepID=UPI00101BA46D|nr:hypothetical protein [Mycoplasmopsis columboralis]